jgi:hypothetical protein
MFNRTILFTGALIYFFCFLASPSLQAKSDAEIEEAIQATLAQRHPTDTPDWWRDLGGSAPRIIINMYEKSDSTYHRIRLVEALGWFSDDDGALEFLKEEAERTQASVVRNAAVKSVGASQGPRELEFIGKYLGHADPQTRLAAAQTLKRMKDPRADLRLEQYVKEEKLGWIKAQIKGEPVRPSLPLVPVASTEDRVNSKFSGNWRGYWITPKEGPSGMRSVAAVLRLELEGATGLRGELILSEIKSVKKKETRSFTLKSVKAKASHFLGVLPGDTLSVGRQAKANLRALPVVEQISVEAELIERSGMLLIEMKATGVVGTLLVRKDEHLITQ